jgi:hypothetical protein
VSGGVSTPGTEIYPSQPWRPAKVRFESISTLQPVCPSTGANGCYFGWNQEANNGQGQNYPINKSALTSIAYANPGQQPTLTSYNIIVTGAEQIYQILRVQVTSPSGVQFADVLIPRYEANPNVYRDTRNPLLHTIHPLWSEINYGMDSNAYKQRILSLFYF